MRRCCRWAKRNFNFLYNTVAAVIHTGGYRWLGVRSLYSATTRRHISAFAAEFGVSYEVAKRIAATGYIYNIDTGEVKKAGYTNIEKAIERALSATDFYTERIK